MPFSGLGFAIYWILVDFKKTANIMETISNCNFKTCPNTQLPDQSTQVSGQDGQKYRGAEIKHHGFLNVSLASKFNYNYLSKTVKKEIQ